MNNIIKFLKVPNTRKSSIEWTNQTWNPTIGCRKYAKACRFCYAEKEHNRKVPNEKQPKYTTKFPVFKTHEESLKIPKRDYKKGDVVFVNSMSDLFHKDCPLEFIQKVFKEMNETPDVIYQVLTKRAGELLKHSSHLKWTDNIWMGVTVGSKKDVSKIDKLRQCGAKHRFLSIEPLVEELENLNLKGIDSVMIGGESYMQSDGLDLKRSLMAKLLEGEPLSERKSLIKEFLPEVNKEAERLIKEYGGKTRKALMSLHQDRWLKIEWVRKVIKNCESQNVPIFFKQWGMLDFNPDQNDPTLNKLHRYSGKGGSMVDGKIYRDNPVIEFKTPTVNVFGKDYYVMDKLGDLNTIWELKSYQIMAEDKVYANLKQGIKINGIIDPILYTVLENGVKLIIDGHTRMRIATELNMEMDIPVKEVKLKFKSLTDIKLWMRQHQNNRRNLSDAEKLQSILDFQQEIEERFETKKANKKVGEKPIKRSVIIAEMAAVNSKQAERFCAVMNYTDEHVKSDMLDGTISIYAASEKVKALKREAKASKEAEKIVVSDSTDDKVEKDGDIEGFNDVQLSIVPQYQPKTTKVLSIKEGKQKLEDGDIDVFIVARDMSYIEKYLKENDTIGYYISHNLISKAS